MKKTLTLMIAALGLSLNVSCGSKSDGGGGAAATTPTDTTTTTITPPTPDFQCEHWQVYHESYGCLSPRNCGMYGPEYGFYNNTCVRGTRYSAIPTGQYDAAIPVVNAGKFQELMRDSRACWRQSACTAPSQVYLYISIGENGNYQVNGPHMGVYGVLGSSFFGVQTSFQNGGGGRGIQIYLNAYNGITSNFSLNRNTMAYPTTDGFQALLNGSYSSHAVDERLSFKFTPTDVSRNTLHVTITYQNVVIAEGNITK